MMKRNANSFTSGTSALVVPRWVQNPDEATIIAFPRKLQTVQAEEQPTRHPSSQQKGRGSLARRLVDSSEMICSLRYESMLGCPYHLFTRSGVVALSAGSAIIGIISLILGS